MVTSPPSTDPPPPAPAGGSPHPHRLGPRQCSVLVRQWPRVLTPPCRDNDDRSSGLGGSIAIPFHRWLQSKGLPQGDTWQVAGPRFRSPSDYTL